MALQKYCSTLWNIASISDACRITIDLLGSVQKLNDPDKAL